VSENTTGKPKRRGMDPEAKAYGECIKALVALPPVARRRVADTLMRRCLDEFSESRVQVLPMSKIKEEDLKALRNTLVESGMMAQDGDEDFDKSPDPPLAE